MIILTFILLILSILQVVFVSNVKMSDISNELPLGNESLVKIVLGGAILEGLLGMVCSVYILSII